MSAGGIRSRVQGELSLCLFDASGDEGCAGDSERGGFGQERAVGGDGDRAGQCPGDADEAGYTRRGPDTDSRRVSQGEVAVTKGEYGLP